MKRTTNMVYPLVEAVSKCGFDDPVTAKFLTRRYRNVSRELAYPETPDSSIWKTWRKQLRSNLRKYLCLDDWGIPSNPTIRVLEEINRDGYIRRKIAYESVPDNWVVAYLLVPERVEGLAPAIVCAHGHVKGGKLSVVDPKFAVGVAYGHEFAKRGCVVLAPDNAGMGQRDITASQLGRNNVGGCELLYRRLSHMGLDITGLRVFELMVGINILANIEQVDGLRVGCAGLSGGCWLAEVLTALDRRIKAVILSGFFTTFMQTVWNGHCICHLTHGLGKICDMPDIAALIAPRPLFIESGRHDQYYPVEPAYSLTRKAYTLLRVEQNLELDVYEGGHMFYGKNSIPWIIKQLNR